MSARVCIDYVDGRIISGRVIHESPTAETIIINGISNGVIISSANVSFENGELNDLDFSTKYRHFSLQIPLVFGPGTIDICVNNANICFRSVATYSGGNYSPSLIFDIKDHVVVGTLFGGAPLEYIIELFLDDESVGQVFSLTYAAAAATAARPFKLFLHQSVDESLVRIIARIVGPEKGSDSVSGLSSYRLPSEEFFVDDAIWGSFDGLSGTVATGWAWNPNAPTDPVTVDFFVGNKLVGAAKASAFREDVKAAGFGSGNAGFFADLYIDITSDDGSPVNAFVRGTNIELKNSPKFIQFPKFAAKWLTRSQRATPSIVARLRRKLNKIEPIIFVSIVMPCYNSNIEWLEEAIESVRSQWYDCWELICVNDGSPDIQVEKTLRKFASIDARIQIVINDNNRGIAAAINAGLKRASGQYVALMDHDDYIEPEAIYLYAKAAQTGADLIYCDELITGSSINQIRAIAARPAFSHDYYINHPYFVHMICVKRSIATQIGGWDEALSISGDVDFVLRVVERANLVAHIPAILYRWRTHVTSSGHSKQSSVMEATRGIIERHLKRIGLSSSIVSATNLFNQFKVDFLDPGAKTAIIIPTKNRGDLLRKCIESIERTTRRNEIEIVVINHESDEEETIKYLSSIRERHKVMLYAGPFNFSRMNNLAVATLDKSVEFILMMNNDIECLHFGWLERMRSIAKRPDVGIVGATLLYDNYTIQHSGVIIGMLGAADHAHKFQNFVAGEMRNPGYLCSLTSLREYSAVTAACMILRKCVFEEVGGFDERLAIGFNDTDLCLRVFDRGYKILNDGFTILLHHESATRSVTAQLEHPEDRELFRMTWARVLREGDPFYSPLLTTTGPDHTIALSAHETKNVGNPRLVYVSFRNPASI